ncbi:hypothetical protein GCK32_019194, partial [Trichostrongylus colubriformis]
EYHFLLAYRLNLIELMTWRSVHQQLLGFLNKQRESREENRNQMRLLGK